VNIKIKEKQQVKKQKSTSSDRAEKPAQDVDSLENVRHREAFEQLLSDAVVGVNPATGRK